MRPCSAAVHASQSPRSQILQAPHGRCREGATFRHERTLRAQQTILAVRQVCFLRAPQTSNRTDKAI
jgi:hypothetical protein